MPSLVEIGPVILENKYFFYFFNVFTLYRNYLPLGKDMALYLKKLKSPLPEDALCRVWVEIGSVVLENEYVKNLQIYGQRDRRRKTGDQKRLL